LVAHSIKCRSKAAKIALCDLDGTYQIDFVLAGSLDTVGFGDCANFLHLHISSPALPASNLAMPLHNKMITGRKLMP